MGTKSKEVDAYIAKSPEYARPILTRLRAVFHRGCSDLEERIKWGVPSFEYKGMLCGMAAFKKHVAWGFWKAALLNDPHGIMKSDASSSFGGGKPTCVEELPPDKMILDLLKQAVALNERGVKVPQRMGGKKKPPPKVPADLAAALKMNRKAAATYESFSPSHKREYIEWITEAKQDETRARRLAQAIEWMAEGKPRNWKYMKC